MPTFPFRPWVRRTCRRAMGWGLGLLGVLATVAWLLRDRETEVLGHAFGVLLAYSLLFWASLAKIWWTAARRPAVELTHEAILYQPVHLFRPSRVRLDSIVACGPRAGTESQRFVVEGPRRLRELFLNLAVIEGRHTFLRELGAALEARGLTARGKNEWARPEWSEPEGHR